MNLKWKMLFLLLGLLHLVALVIVLYYQWSLDIGIGDVFMLLSLAPVFYLLFTVNSIFYFFYKNYKRDKYSLLKRPVKQLRQEKHLVYLYILDSIFFLLIAYIIYHTYQATPQPGMEFFAIFLAQFFYIVGFPFLVLTIFRTLRYFYKYRTSGVSKISPLIFTVLSSGVLIWHGLDSLKGMVEINLKELPISKNEAIQLINDCEVDSVSRHLTGEQDGVKIFLKDNSIKNGYDNDFDQLREAAISAHPKCGKISTVDLLEIKHPLYISIDEANALLMSCQLVGVYSNNYEKTLQEESIPLGTSSGIILLNKEDPRHIHTRSDVASEVESLAFEARKRCPDLYIYRDRGNDLWRTINEDGSFME